MRWSIVACWQCKFTQYSFGNALLCSFHVPGISRPYKNISVPKCLSWSKAWRCHIICSQDNRLKKKKVPKDYIRQTQSQILEERGFMAVMGQMPGPMTEAIQDGSLLGHMLLGERWGGAPWRCCVNDSSTDLPALWEDTVLGCSPPASNNLVSVPQYVIRMFSFSMWVVRWKKKNWENSEIGSRLRRGYWIWQRENHWSLK